MAILLKIAPLPADSYWRALKAAAGDVPVWREDEPHDPAAVESLLAWRLAPGEAAQYPNLRVVSSIGAGVDKLMPPDLPPSVAITRASDPDQARQIAQYVAAVTLRHLRELPRYEAQQAQAHWERHRVRPPSASRIGVLGLGQVGSAIASTLQALALPVSGWSRSPRDLHGVRCLHGADGLDTLLASSDVLVCALPLTAETRGLLNRDRLSKLPAGSYVVNVGRGEQLVEPNLQALLDSGHLAGAALDVYEREPPKRDNWVWHHPKVLATPHIAGENDHGIVAQQCVEALHHARAGRAQPLGVDRATGY